MVVSARNTSAEDSRVAPERRTALDVVIAFVLVIAVVVAGVVLWMTGSAYNSQLEVHGEATRAPSITREPSGLKLVWSADSPVTASRLQRGALTAGTTVIVGNNHTVAGLDPVTGAPTWTYTRDRSLCAMETAWGNAITVWNYGNGCGDVVSIVGATGKYGPTRSWNANTPRRILTGGMHVLSLGPNQLEVWRSDMVRTLALGYMQTPLEPAHKNRTVCEIVDAEEDDSTLGVVEKCPKTSGLRLSIYTAVPKDDVEPELLGRVQLKSQRADIIEISHNRALVYTESPEPELLVVTRSGTVVRRKPVERADALHRPIFRTDKSVFWFDGQRLYNFARNDFSTRWVMDGAVGMPGVLSSLENSPNWLLVPVDKGIAIVNGRSGEKFRLLPIQGPAISRVVVFSGMIIVQQGPLVKGFRPLFDE